MRYAYDGAVSGYRSVPARVSLDDLNAWLSETLDAPPLGPAGKGKWKTRGQHQGESVPVLLVDNAADGFASLWFDSAHTPGTPTRSARSTRPKRSTWKSAVRWAAGTRR